LLENEGHLPYQKIAFRSQEKIEDTLCDLLNIGMEKTTSAEYIWNGLTRQERDVGIFQYTISGEGAIYIMGETFRLLPGQAFIVKVPSEHVYYLPKESEGWEFIFITLTGPAVLSCWDKVISRTGPVISLDVNTELIKHLYRTYHLAYNEGLFDPYFASAQAYTFIMELYRHIKQSKTCSTLPASIQSVVQYIEKNYHLQLTVEDLALEAGLSKYHLIRRFGEVKQMTPGQYLTKVRIEKAFELLLHTDIPIKEIALKVGYMNDNYFNKAFRKVVGVSPGRFRKNPEVLPFNRLIIR